MSLWLRNSLIKPRGPGPLATDGCLYKGGLGKVVTSSTKTVWVRMKPKLNFLFALILARALCNPLVSVCYSEPDPQRMCFFQLHPSRLTL